MKLIATSADNVSLLTSDVFIKNNIKALLIRIFNSKELDPIGYKSIKHDIFYKILNITFDDFDYNEINKLDSVKKTYPNVISFNKSIAKKIIEFVSINKNNVNTIIIHCTAGVSRSPAILIALNDIFHFNTIKYKEKYPSYNKYVYDVMKNIK